MQRDGLLAADHARVLLAMHGTGCTDSVRPTAWRKGAEKKLARLGLRMLRILLRRVTFRGLAGTHAETVATWRMPVGINGMRTEMAASEIEGSMPTLVSQSDLDRWGCNLYLAYTHD